MPKKKQDLKPDTVLKNYWNNKEQFADLFNAALFDGRPVIRPEELEDVDTEESSIFGTQGIRGEHPGLQGQYKNPQEINRAWSRACHAGQ